MAAKAPCDEVEKGPMENLENLVPSNFDDVLNDWRIWVGGLYAVCLLQALFARF